MRYAQEFMAITGAQGTPMQVSPAATPRPHYAEESAQSDQQPSAQAAAELQSDSSSGSDADADADMLPKLAIFFMQLAHAASCYWASPTPVSHSHLGPCSVHMSAYAQSSISCTGVLFRCPSHAAPVEPPSALRACAAG